MLGNPVDRRLRRASRAALRRPRRSRGAAARRDARRGCQRFWPYAARPATARRPRTSDAYARYCELMSRSQALVAEDVLDAFPPRGRRAWLDVGGGEGAFLGALAARSPTLDADAVRSAAGRRARPRGARDARRFPRGRGVRAATSSPTRCRTAPTSCRWCACCTTTTTNRRWRCCAAPMRRCRAAACCWSPSRWRRRRRRAGRRRLFRLLPAGHGPRPAALGRGNRRAWLREAGFAAARALNTRRPLLASVVTGARRVNMS